MYSKILPGLLNKNGQNFDDNSGPVVVIVCGGSDASVDILNCYAKGLGLDV